MTDITERSSLSLQLDPNLVANAHLHLRHDVSDLTVGTAHKKDAQHILARTPMYSDGYHGEQVALEHALTEGLALTRELEDVHTLLIAPPSIQDGSFPAEPAALIVLMTLVRLVREDPEAFGPISIVLGTPEDHSAYSAAWNEVQRTMMG